MPDRAENRDWRSCHDGAVKSRTGCFYRIEVPERLAILLCGPNPSPNSGDKPSRFIMIRTATLLPVFVLALSLTGAGLAMAQGGKQGADRQHDKSSAYANSCSDRPMYENPSYCQPHGNKR
jgi:hypothetical protein